MLIVRVTRTIMQSLKIQAAYPQKVLIWKKNKTETNGLAQFQWENTELVVLTWMTAPSKTIDSRTRTPACITTFLPTVTFGPSWQHKQLRWRPFIKGQPQA